MKQKKDAYHTQTRVILGMWIECKTGLDQTEVPRRLSIVNTGVPRGVFAVLHGRVPDRSFDSAPCQAKVFGDLLIGKQPFAVRVHFTGQPQDGVTLLFGQLLS